MAAATTLSYNCKRSDSTSFQSININPVRYLKKALDERVNRIYLRIMTESYIPPSGVILQKTVNKLHRSIQHVSSGFFFPDTGQCLGACEWFMSLFLNFKKKYPDVKTDRLLIEIAKEFKDGVGLPGALLQNHYRQSAVEQRQPCLHGELLRGLSIEALKVFEIRTENISEDFLNSTIFNMTDGIYLIVALPGSGMSQTLNFRGHAMLTIVDQGNHYFFEPNTGLLGTGQDIGSLDKHLDVKTIFGAIRFYYSPSIYVRGWFHNFLSTAQHIVPEMAKELLHGVDIIDSRYFFTPEKEKRIILQNLIFSLFDKFNVSRLPLQQQMMLNYNLSYLPYILSLAFGSMTVNLIKFT